MHRRGWQEVEWRSIDTGDSMDLILLYHRIADDGWQYSVSPRHFAEQLDVLHHFADVISLPELVRGRSSRHASTRVALTFDDGYGDNVTQAYPPLERHATPATFFIVSGHVGSTREFWWDELEYLLFHATTRAQRIELTIGDEHRMWHLGIDDRPSETTGSARMPMTSKWEKPRDRAHRDLHELLRRSPPDDQRRILSDLAVSMGVIVHPRLEKLPVSHEQLQSLLRNALAEIGAHTVEHLMLPLFPNHVQRGEISRSKRDLEEMTGRKVLSFAYPYGAYSDDTVAFVEQSGFQMACTVGERPIGEDDSFRIPRLTPRNWNGDVFAEHLQRVLKHA